MLEDDILIHSLTLEKIKTLTHKVSGGSCGELEQKRIFVNRPMDWFIDRC